MHQKIRQEHDLNATRDQVYSGITEFDQEGLKAISRIGSEKEGKKVISQQMDLTGSILLMTTIS